MPILSYDLTRFAIGVNDWGRSRAWIESNADDGWKADGRMVLPDAVASVSTDGTGAIELEPTPEGIKYQFVLRYHQPGANTSEAYWRSGWFSLTADANLVDLATVDVKPVPEAPVVAQLLEARDAAQTAAAEAEAAKAAAEAVGSTNDTIIAGRIEDPESATNAALKAKVAQEMADDTSALAQATEERIDVAAAGFVRKTGTLTESLARTNYTAHRSGDGEFPGGTMYAYQASFETGSEFLDLDIHTLSDGTLVAFHDEQVDDLTDGTGLLADFTLPRYKQLNCNVHDLHPALGPLAPVTFPELAAQFAYKIAWMLDIRHVDSIPALVELVDRYDIRESVIFGCHTTETLTAIKNLSDAEVAAGRAPYTYLQSYVEYVHGNPPVLTNPTPTEAIALGASLLSFNGDAPYTDSIAGELAAAVAGTDVTLRSWTINRRWQRDYLKNTYGVTSFSTDHPVYLKAEGPLSKVDSWRDGVRGYGLMTPFSFWGGTSAMKIANGALNITSANATIYILHGEISGRTSTTWSRALEVGFETIPSANPNTPSVRISFGSSDDRLHSNANFVPGSGQIYISRAGELRLYYAATAGALTQVNPVTPGVISVGAFAAGVTKDVRIDVTPATITVTVDGGTAHAFPNPGIAGEGYVHYGKINAEDATMIVKNVRVPA